MDHLTDKLIIYDGACPLCRRLHAFVVRYRILPAEKLVSYYDLPEDLLAQVDPDRFRNEMALLDTGNGSVQYGPTALTYIFSGRSRLLKFLLHLPLVPALVRFVYRVISANRYQLATPLATNGVRCTCAPDRPLKYRLAYLLWCLSWAVGVTMLFGAGLSYLFADAGPMDGARQMLLIAGTGWAVQLLAGLAFLRRRANDYPEHLATVMRKGVMPLLPVAVWFLLAGGGPVWAPVTAVALSAGLMLRQHFLRIRALGLPQGWTASWFASLQLTAAAWVWFFHFQ